MWGNALVLKTPVENIPRTSIEKHLSWFPDIPPAARFPLHRSGMIMIPGLTSDSDSESIDPTRPADSNRVGAGAESLAS